MESPAKRQRRTYICRQCGQPKKDHVCTATEPPQNQAAAPQTALVPVNQETTSVAPETQGPILMLPAPPSWDGDFIVPPGRFRAVCLRNVLQRLKPKELVVASTVCKGWRDAARRLCWKLSELRLTDCNTLSLLLKERPGLERLFLRHNERDFDLETLSAIALNCEYLQVLEISVRGAASNNITGDELSRFVSNKQRLTGLRMTGCSCLEKVFIPSSPTLSSLNLLHLGSLSVMSFNCPNLKEISLLFSRQQNDATDLVKMVEDLGKTCPNLHSIWISSTRLSDSVVNTLTAARFSGLRNLDLASGIDITDASVAAIYSCYTKLEQLGLSGSSITDVGLFDICEHMAGKLSHLRVPYCPNITSNGIQHATAFLPLLELMDCSSTISGNQNLYIKHGLLKKLRLWRCSGLHVLILSCPELNNLEMDFCTNLQPGKLKFNCPKLQSVHARGCPDPLVQAIRQQVKTECVVESADL